MEGECKVILSALTSVGYIGYYIVSVYKVYVHGARVQRLRFHRRGKFFINGLRTAAYTRARACACVYACTCSRARGVVHSHNNRRALILSKIVADETDTVQRGSRSVRNLQNCFNFRATKPS